MRQETRWVHIIIRSRKYLQIWSLVNFLLTTVMGLVDLTMVAFALYSFVFQDDDGDDSRTEQATTCAHCLNLVFTVCGLSPRLIMVWGLPDGEDKSGSETADEYDMDEEDDEDIDEELEMVS